MVVHGDDFTALGWEAKVNWYRDVVTGQFEAKVKRRIGPGKKDEKSMRCLNRMTHWTDAGIEYEADHRHAEIIATELRLGTGSNSVITPGVSMNKGGNQ